MKTLYVAQATTTGGRNGNVKTDDGVLDLEVRTPKGLGGQGGAFTNPEQLFAAGYSACFGSAISYIAGLQKIEVQNVEVTAQVGIGQLATGGFGLEAELQVKIPNLDREAAQKLMEAAHQACPYSNATRGNMEVKLQLID